MTERKQLQLQGGRSEAEPIITLAPYLIPPAMRGKRGSSLITAEIAGRTASAGEAGPLPEQQDMSDILDVPDQ
ncbi:MAG TPA: hypothetical protein ENN65_00115 [Candidatus Hydrogenedentes bacterium]|nr:hypothetical protein [Candidatus Hydrogenedentota bacterium]